MIRPRPKGQGYSYAIREAAKHGGEVVHGHCLFPRDIVARAPVFLGGRYEHAWVERDGLVYDWQNRNTGPVSATAFYLDRDPVNVQRYTSDEAVDLALRTNCWGPWLPEERGGCRDPRSRRGRWRP